MPKTIAIVGALDTKGPDFAFVREQIEARGHRALVIDTSVVEDPPFEPDVPAARVAEAGGSSLEELRKQADKGSAMAAMTKGIAVVIQELHDEGKIDAILSMGGSAGTAVGTSAMRVLPLGFPKVMVSTVASGDTGPYVGIKDIVMIPSVVDVAGGERAPGAC